MRVTVCQISNEPGPLEAQWSALCEHVGSSASDLVVLPEMPFASWLPATRDVDRNLWRASVTVHRRWCERLHELGAAAVFGSRPVDDPLPRNRAFAWIRGAGLVDLHDKAYLPDEEGFWEASWYERGEPAYRLVQVPDGAGGDARVGVLLCTEMWFLEHARKYGRDGAQLVVVPRATPGSTLDKWIAGGRAAAVVAGAYCLSSAPCTGPGSAADLGGGSWVVDPEGEVLGLTQADAPFLTVDIDLGTADAARATYPRYVPEAC